MRRCAFRFPAWYLGLLLLAGCFSDTNFPDDQRLPFDEQPETVLTIFSAVSLTQAFTEIAWAFEESHPGVDVVLNLAGSQQLAQQLVLGAPADVFASADQRQMQIAVDAGRIESGAPVSFARNRLVVVLPKENSAQLTLLRDLARPGLRLVLAAGAVPVGRYSRVFLEKASGSEAFGPEYEDQVLANVASFEQNVRAVLTKVALDEADAGIVYMSDLAGSDAKKVARIDIPDELNTMAVYPIAPLADGAHPDLARAFIAFVCSAEGQAILTYHGFMSEGLS